jgi:hypothetical protein
LEGGNPEGAENGKAPETVLTLREEIDNMLISHLF